MTVTGATRVGAVIGDPVAHSLSPIIHNAAFAATGFDATFVALPVRPADLGAAIAGVRALDLLGLSVTMPHKAAVISHLDDVRHEAAALSAVNCVVRDGGRLVGTNTDGAGFVDALTAASVDLVGATRWLRRISARASTDSTIEKCWPMHARGPPPNGIHA